MAPSSTIFAPWPESVSGAVLPGGSLTDDVTR